MLIVCRKANQLDTVRAINLYANRTKKKDIYDTDDGKQGNDHISKLVKPLLVTSDQDSTAVAETVGRFDKSALLRLLELFPQEPLVQEMCADHNFDGKPIAFECI